MPYNKWQRRVLICWTFLNPRKQIQNHDTVVAVVHLQWLVWSIFANELAALANWMQINKPTSLDSCQSLLFQRSNTKIGSPLQLILRSQGERHWNQCALFAKINKEEPLISWVIGKSELAPLPNPIEKKCTTTLTWNTSVEPLQRDCIRQLLWKTNCGIWEQIFFHYKFFIFFRQLYGLKEVKLKSLPEWLN